jgi:predicted lipoprotein with Yx(FWY)xxD motif
LKRALIGFSLLAGLTLAFAACSSGAKATPTPSATTQAAVPTVAATATATPAAATVTTRTDSALGAILVGPNGFTLYVSKNDAPNQSNCNPQCLAVWPPLTAAAGATPVAGPGVTGKLSVITRSDGTSQVAYNGAPLYFWKSDAKAGDATGQGVGPFTVALVTSQAVASPTASATAKAGG